VYYLVAVWAPRLLMVAPEETEPGIVPLDIDRAPDRLGEVFTIARSEPVRVEVLPAGAP
jgi:hypothetical protein